MAKLNRRLHLVIPIEQDSGTIYAHMSLIATDQFQRYFMVMGKTFADIYTKGLGAMAGPKVAALLLRKNAEDMEQGQDVEDGLIGDIKRLTNICCPTSNGWQAIPFQQAIDNKLVDTEDAAEVENAAVFFTLAWHMHRRAERETIITSAAAIWGAQPTSSGCTEYLASLPTSTTAGASTLRTA